MLSLFGKPGLIKQNRLFREDGHCFWLFSLFCLFLFGCTPSNNQYKPPELSVPENPYHIGKFVWHDLLTNNTVDAKRFYSGLFGWRFRPEKGVEESSFIINRGKIIGNIRVDIHNIRGENNAIWLSSLSVPDVDKVVAIVKSHGGEIFAGPTNLADRGTIAIVSDPQGAALMLLRAGGGDTVDSKPQVGEWLWMELWTRDLLKAAEFYQALVAYQTVDKQDNTSENYQRFKQKGVVRAGMVKVPVEEVKPNWLPYVRVNNVRKALAKVRQLGGRIIIEPDTKEVEQGNIAVIADPGGGVLAIQELRNK
jgi:predicted enzyme related to lactoylglutathione lyase